MSEEVQNMHQAREVIENFGQQVSDLTETVAELEQANDELEDEITELKKTIATIAGFVEDIQRSL